MISTKSLISELNEVPREWVFEHYLKLEVKLCGQDHKVKSPFSLDKTASFCIYFSKHNNRYMFKDFSTGKSGDGITLVQSLGRLTTRGEAAHKVITDYNQVTLNKEDFSLREFKIQEKYRVTEFVKRSWTNLDQKFWMSFHIGSKLLEHYQVFPLQSYKMIKEINGDLKELIIEGSNYIYGYFRTDGILYKIYQPMTKDNKFIKVREYIQGTDQLLFKGKYLIINSSLKDIMAFTRLGYKEAESTAPDSENTLIPLHVMNSYKLKYKAICTLFDQDLTGIKAMNKYESVYGVKGALLPLSKDLSDSMRDHSIQKVKEVLTPILKQALL